MTVPTVDGDSETDVEPAKAWLLFAVTDPATDAELEIEAAPDKVCGITDPVVTVPAVASAEDMEADPVSSWGMTWFAVTAPAVASALDIDCAPDNS